MKSLRSDPSYLQNFVQDIASFKTTEYKQKTIIQQYSASKFEKFEDRDSKVQFSNNY